MKEIIQLFIVLVCFSCHYTRIDDSINLGNKYRYIQDAPNTIIYHKSKEYQGVGIEIVPPIVLSYKFNNRYIIAKSLNVDEKTGNNDGKSIFYWIIDKETNGDLVKPLDSLYFNNQLRLLNIDMTL
ncbi:MAG: hypothetical protein HC892_07510 [Saprospiraceae bacterium]|nr:hypothetical protein [Saprospiraceae bacterium]